MTYPKARSGPPENPENSQRRGVALGVARGSGWCRSDGRGPHWAMVRSGFLGRVDEKQHGFLRAATGAFTTIDVPGAYSTGVYGINDAGQIVGDFLGADEKQHGFLRTGTGAH